MLAAIRSYKHQVVPVRLNIADGAGVLLPPDRAEAIAGLAGELEDRGLRAGVRRRARRAGRDGLRPRARAPRRRHDGVGGRRRARGGDPQLRRAAHGVGGRHRRVDRQPRPPADLRVAAAAASGQALRGLGRDRRRPPPRGVRGDRRPPARPGRARRRRGRAGAERRGAGPPGTLRHPAPARRGLRIHAARRLAQHAADPPRRCRPPRPRAPSAPSAPARAGRARPRA